MSFIKKASCPACGSRDNVGVHKDKADTEQGFQLNGKCFGCGELYWDMDLTDPLFDYRQWPSSDAPGRDADLEAMPQAPAPMQQAQATTQAAWKPVITVDEILQLPMLEVPERWTQEGARWAEIRSLVNGVGQTTHIYYPYKVDGRVQAFKERDLVNKDFRTIGNFKGVDLFLSDKYPEGGPLVILTEGEDDAGAAREMARMCNRNYRVESIHTGATINQDTGEGVVDKPLKRKLPDLSKFNAVYLCMDQDQAGRAVAKAIAEELAVYAEVRFINFSLKDCRAMWLENRHMEFIQAFDSAVRYVPDSIIRGEDVSLERLMQPLREGLPLPYPILQEKMHGLRYGPESGGELTLLCAGSGMGKTTMLRAIEAFTVQHTPVRIGNIKLEEQYTKTVQAAIAAYWRIPLPVLRENPQLLTLEQWQEAKAAMVDGRQVYHNHFGSIASDKLMNKFHYMATREKVELITFDHISMAIAGQNAGRGGERKDIDMLMAQLASFVTVTGVHVIAVVHLNRGDRKLKKDSEGRVVLESAPYDYGGIITKEDMRGSGGLEQMAHNIWALEGDLNGLDGRSPLDRWIRILKCREWGNVGLADTLTFEERSGILLPKILPEKK